MSAATLNFSRIGQSDLVCIEDWTQTTANLPAFNQAPLVAALDGPVSAQHDSNQNLLVVPMGNHHGNKEEIIELCLSYGSYVPVRKEIPRSRGSCLSSERACPVLSSSPKIPGS